MTTRITSVLLVLLGLAMVVVAFAGGGGPLAQGVIVGVLFCAAGAGRLYLSIR